MSSPTKTESPHGSLSPALVLAASVQIGVPCYPVALICNSFVAHNVEHLPIQVLAICISCMSFFSYLLPSPIWVLCFPVVELVLHIVNIFSRLRLVFYDDLVFLNID